LNTSAINCEKALEDPNLSMERHWIKRRCYDFSCVTSCPSEQNANDQDCVSGQLRDARRISCLPDTEVRVSNALYRKN